ncbi:MAG: PAS domain-containing protein [Candidatus Thorarchaeota archaeon]
MPQENTDEIKILEKRIAELEKEKQELLNFKQEITEIISPINSLMFIIDKDGTYLKISPLCPENLLIMPAKDLQGKKMKDIFPTGRAQFFLNYIKQALEEKKSNSIEYILPIQGRNVWIESRVIPILEENKEPTKVLAVLRDITKWRSKKEL